MSYSRLVLRDRSDIVWPLNDLTESSSISVPINFYSGSAIQYSASINASATQVVGIPIVFGGGSALRLTNGSVPNITIPLFGKFSELYDKKEYSLEFWLQCEKVPSEEITIAVKKNNPNIGLFLKNNYLIYRYGNSSSYMEVSYGLAEITEPTHIVMSHGLGSIELTVNGVSRSTTNENGIYLPADSSHSSNDFMYFYGSSAFNMVIDSPALYSFILKSNTAKSHYVYGLGKSIDQRIFNGLGGDFYNLSTTKTRKSFYQVWDDPSKWTLTRYDNTINSIDGIRPAYFNTPEIQSLDDKLRYSDNTISFTSSAGNTVGSYIDIRQVADLLGDGSNPFFVKVKLDGTAPVEGAPQTIMSIGTEQGSPIIDFNIENLSSSYFLVARNNISTGSVRMEVRGITASPTAYVGMRFDNQAIFYFSISGSPLYTASLTSYSGSQFDVDYAAVLFPPTDETTIRIGSALTYDSDSDDLDLINRRQFNGTFLQFLSTKNDFVPTDFNSINSYSKPIYSLTHSTSLSRFKVKSFGNTNFILHGARIAQSDTTGSAIMSGNRIEFGHPDIVSGSEVSFYATMYDYNDNVVYPKTKITKISSLNWANLINLSNRYIRIDIDFLSDDVTEYPPYIKYFKIDTYPSSGSFVQIIDDSGSLIKINNSQQASAQAFAPEIDSTPSIMLNDYSGIRVYRNTVDFNFSPMPKSFNPNSLSNLLLWYDSRFPAGLSKTRYEDSASNSIWISLGASAIHASVTAVALNPHYRQQSLNALSINQMNGAESGSVTDFFITNASAQSSTDISVSGNRSIKIVPTGTSSDTHISLFYDPSSPKYRFLYPGQQYTAVGTISLLKSQSTSETRARRIVVYSSSTSPLGTLSTASSTSASNAAGSYFASVTFTVHPRANQVSLRFYNGSSVSGDPVYWDNMAVYAGSVVSGSPVVYYDPLETFDDRPVYKFNGTTHNFISSASSRQPVTVYVAARVFNASGTIIGHSASAPAIYYESNTFRMSAGQVLIGASVNNDFNIFVGVFNNNSSSFFVNSSVVSGNVGTGSYSSAMRIGYRQLPVSANDSYLSGDIAGVLLFNTAHNKTQIDQLTAWMKDAFNIS